MSTRPGARFLSLAAEATARLEPRTRRACRPLESTDVHDHHRRSRGPRRLQRPARVDRMDRAHRRRAHRPRVRDAGPAAASRRARHPGRPVGDGPARAFGTPRHHRTGAPCAPGLVAGPDAQEAAEDLLAPVLRNHSHRAYAWAAAIAARRGISFDRELLYLAAMFHDTGLPSPVRASTSPCAARRWPASSPTATECPPTAGRW